MVNEDLNSYPYIYARNCEGLRTDISFLRLPLITYKWWKTHQLSQLPNLAYPGARHHPFEQGSFNLSAFLDANVNTGRFPGGVYVAGPWQVR